MLLYYKKETGKVVKIQFGKNTPLFYDEDVNFVETLNNLNLSRGDFICINPNKKTISINNQGSYPIIQLNEYVIIDESNCNDPILLEKLN